MMELKKKKGGVERHINHKRASSAFLGCVCGNWPGAPSPFCANSPPV